MVHRESLKYVRAFFFFFFLSALDEAQIPAFILLFASGQSICFFSFNSLWKLVILRNLEFSKVRGYKSGRKEWRGEGVKGIRDRHWAVQGQ